MADNWIAHVRALVVGYALQLHFCGGLQVALLDSTDGVRQRRVNARVGHELGGNAGAALRAAVLAFRRPPREAGQAEVVLASRGLQCHSQPFQLYDRVPGDAAF